ncbi:hypothetical protein FPQ18DRAFT_301482 [Pyronema domesticum]|nr:hypothetical protein FPQ18DRAFT_301482 [Pyronema domesticum]
MPFSGFEIAAVVLGAFAIVKESLRPVPSEYRPRDDAFPGAELAPEPTGSSLKNAAPESSPNAQSHRIWDLNGGPTGAGREVQVSSVIFNEEENAVQRYCKENDISDEDMEDTFGKWQTIAPMTLTTLEKNPFIQSSQPRKGIPSIA